MWYTLCTCTHSTFLILTLHFKGPCSSYCCTICTHYRQHPKLLQAFSISQEKWTETKRSPAPCCLFFFKAPTLAWNGWIKSLYGLSRACRPVPSLSELQKQSNNLPQQASEPKVDEISQQSAPGT